MRETASPDSCGTVEAFYDEVTQAFEQACEQRPETSHDLLIAGQSVRLSFAGDAMIPCFVPAMQHLCCDSQRDAALQVRIFDSASTGIALPTPPWTNDAQVARGEILGLDTSGSVRATFQPGSAVLTMYHADSATALVWMADAQRCPDWEAAAPLRGLFHWWFSAQGQQLVHAAAVGTESGAVLLTGKGGSGKSTTALTALAAGMQYLGDDYVICDMDEPVPRVHSLYNSAKVGAYGLEMLPALADAVDIPASPELDKAVLYLARSFPDQLCDTLALRAIVVPCVTAGPAQLKPLDPAAAFLALAPTTLFQLPGAGQQTTGFVRRLVTALPCFSLNLGPTPAAVADVLRRALAIQE
ncbi:MAG: hypothetical protein ACI9JM_001462 [Halioglobus sp.]|jgi:hypothetical protein